MTPSKTKMAHSAADLAEYVERPVEDVRDLLDRLCLGNRILRRLIPPPDPDAPEVEPEPRYEIFHDVLADAILAWREERLAERRTRVEREAAERALQEQLASEAARREAAVAEAERSKQAARKARREGLELVRAAATHSATRPHPVARLSATALMELCSPRRCWACRWPAPPRR